MITVFNLISSSYNVNKGIVKYMSLKSTQPDCFLFAVFHQLLGKCNNSKKKLYHIADGFFETLTQKMIALLDKFTEAEIEKKSTGDHKTSTYCQH